jgi:hypothetical protein
MHHAHASAALLTVVSIAEVFSHFADLRPRFLRNGLEGRFTHLAS